MLLASLRFAVKAIHYASKRWSRRQLQPHLKQGKCELRSDAKKSSNDIPTNGASSAFKQQLEVRLDMIPNHT